MDTSDAGKEGERERDGVDTEHCPEAENKLMRKPSKSRLSKQAEVESEEPPRVAPIGENIRIKVDEKSVESSPVEENVELSPPSKSKPLLRSHALCGDDDTKLSTRSIDRQGSSKTSSMGSSLSPSSSTELTDSTGVNLEEFIRVTLHKNRKDREMLLSLEDKMMKFIESGDSLLHFGPMSSYNRMLVHRIAAWFGLDHNVDQTGTSIAVTRNEEKMRIPEQRFRAYIQQEDFFSEHSEPRRLILQKTHASYEEVRDDDLNPNLRKVRSFEERNDNYLRTRARIFKEDSSSEGYIESPLSAPSSDVSLYTTGSSGLAHGPHLTAIPATHTLPGTHATAGGPYWSSTDSSQEGFLPVPTPHHVVTGERARHLTAMGQKADSFGGVPAVYRGEGKGPPQRSNTDSKDAARTALVRQPAIPERVPLFVNTAAVRPQVQPTPPNDPAQTPVYFAVSSWDAVPPGALLINPATGSYYLNPDGSVYRHGQHEQQQLQQQMSLLTLRSPSPQQSPMYGYAALVPQAGEQASPDPGLSAPPATQILYAGPHVLHVPQSGHQQPSPAQGVSYQGTPAVWSPGQTWYATSAAAQHHQVSPSVTPGMVSPAYSIPASAGVQPVYALPSGYVYAQQGQESGCIPREQGSSSSGQLNLDPNCCTCPTMSPVHHQYQNVPQAPQGGGSVHPPSAAAAAPPVYNAEVYAQECRLAVAVGGGGMMSGGGASSIGGSADAEDPGPGGDQAEAS